MIMSRDTGPDFPGISVAELSTTLLRVFGDRAVSLVAAQAEKAGAEPEIQGRWQQVAETINALLDARAHLERALSCLDAAGETAIAPYVDLAISGLDLDGTVAATLDELDVLGSWSKAGPSATAGD